MQFFNFNGQWLPIDQARKVRERLNKERERFCMYCTSRAVRHTKNCPTRQPDFNPETAQKVELDGSPLN